MRPGTLGLIGVAVLAAACGGARGASFVAGPAPEPSWQDVLDVTPELLVVVHPLALRRDEVYGRALRRLIALARARSRTVTETRAIDAMEDADEVIVGVQRRGAEAEGDEVAVVLGAPSDVDPARLVDSDGRALWAPGPAGPSEAVRELVQASTAVDDAGDASLFELPGRTWIIASGGWRARARAALAHPSGRPRPTIAGDELASIRFDGPSLVEAIGPRSHGAVAALGRRLVSATIELAPGATHEVRAALAYADDGAAASAELRGREILGAIARTKPQGLSWLAAAKVERDADRIVVTAALPLL